MSQIAKSIALKLKAENPNLDVIPEVCEIAGLMHDIGHPPFGHNGEMALDKCMSKYGGFEGNAQTIRVITRLEKKEIPEEKNLIEKNGKDHRVGLNLTARVIASALKYDYEIPIVRENPKSVAKGYYASEKPIIDKVKECLVDTTSAMKNPFKTIECQIMDLADDIAYSTYDVEDALKAEFLTPYDIVAANDSIYEQIVEKLKKDGIKATLKDCRFAMLSVFATIWKEPIEKQKALNKRSKNYEMEMVEYFLKSYKISKELASNGFYRTRLTSQMVNSFINGVKVKINKDCPLLSKVYLDEDILLQVNILKHFSYVSLISSSRLKVAESRGTEIIDKMFNKLINDGYSLLPEDTKELFNISEDDLWRTRVICDFIAGMTDRYALEFYGRLFSENPQTIFKPL